MKLFEKKELVGLDIGANAIKLVQLQKTNKRNGKNYELVKFAFTNIPPNTILEDEIKKPEIIAETIKKIFLENNINTKNVATAISGKSVIVKRIKLPKMTEAELEDSIQWEAEQFIPFDINDVSLDFQIMSEKGATENDMDVLLVAVKKERISDIVNLIELSELTPAVVDIDAFALENMFEINYVIEPDSLVVLINIGAEITCMNVLKGGASVFTRDASIGINHFHRTIQREISLDFSQSEALLKGETVEGRTLNDVLLFRDGFLEELLSEIQRSFDYFRATTESHDIAHIYLSGGGALMGNLPEFIHESLGIPFEIVQPFKNIFIDPKKFDLNYITSIAPMMDVGVGLGLRRIGDR